MHNDQQQSPSALPLAGIRILDFSRLLPGPWCTQMLGDLGADVIKVEAPPGGDGSRHNPPLAKDSSVYFNSVNRNKRSILVNLETAEGKEIVRRLIASADAIVESYSVGVAARLGIDYDAVRAINPRAIYCSITGFGQNGPLANSPGHDLVIQSVAGTLGVTAREEGQSPQVPAFQAADYCAGATACIGILAALQKRHADGEHGVGCYIDLAMYDSLLSMSNVIMTGALGRLSGGSGVPVMEVWGRNPRYTVYSTGDHKTVAVSLLEHRLWLRFCKAIGKPELASEKESLAMRLSDHGERGVTYRAAIAEYCLHHGRDEICEQMAALDIPVCPVLTPDEALVSPQAKARDIVEYIDHPVEGRIGQLKNPLAASGLADAHRRAAPALGANAQEILSELGYTAQESTALQQAGALG